MDFRNVSRLFADPEFDGEPVKIIEIDGKERIPPDDGVDPGEDDPGENDKGEGIDGGEGGEEDDDSKSLKKIYIKGVLVTVLNERVQYVDMNGKLITESIKDYSKRHILEHYDTLDRFIRRWSAEDKKQAIIDELKNEGVLLDALREEVGQDIDDFDDFDLILHIAYDKKPLSRAERANNVKKRNYLNKYSAVAQQVLSGLLEKYQDAEILDFNDTKILELKPFTDLGTPLGLIKAFGTKENYIQAVKELEGLLYA